MKMLTLKIPEELHRELKMYCAKAQITVLSYVLALIEKDKAKRC